MKFLIVLIILLSSYVYVEGTTFPRGPLTVETATNNAVRNSRNISQVQYQVELIDISHDRAENIFFNNPMPITFADIVQRDIRNMQIRANRAFMEENILAQRETLRFVIINHFSNIILAENELALFDAEIEILERELTILRLTYELGMGSYFAVRQAVHNLYIQNHNRLILENTLTQNFIELNRIMGSPSTFRYNVILDEDFAPLEVININSVISRHDRDNINIRNARRQVDIAEEELRVHNIVYYQINPATGDFMVGQTTRREREIAVTEANRDLSYARETSENRLRDLYATIRRIELDIEGLYLQVELAGMSIELLYEQFAAGQIIRLDIYRANLNLLRLEEALNRLKNTHYILITQFNNPYILV